MAGTYLKRYELASLSNCSLTAERYFVSCPYDLRPCWAIRSIHYGLEIFLAAHQMEHSAIIHSQTYHAWLAFQDHQQAFERMLAKPSRPLPPPMREIT
jgi:hypothetical protein